MGHKPNQSSAERRRRFEEIKQQTKRIDTWMSNQGFTRQETDEHHWKYIGHGYGISWWPSTGRLYFHHAKRHLTRYRETFAHSADMLFAEVGHFLANPPTHRLPVTEPERDAAEFVEEQEPLSEDPLMHAEGRAFFITTLELLALAIQEELPVRYRLGDDEVITDHKPGWKHLTILGNKRLQMFAVCRTKEVPLELSDIAKLWRDGDIWIDIGGSSGSRPCRVVNLGRDHVILDTGADTTPYTFQELFDRPTKTAYLETLDGGKQPLRKTVEDWTEVVKQTPSTKPEDEYRHG